MHAKNLLADREDVSASTQLSQSILSIVERIGRIPKFSLQPTETELEILLALFHSGHLPLVSKDEYQRAVAKRSDSIAGFPEAGTGKPER